jgi:iron(III) transport system substrate-binding protein
MVAPAAVQPTAAAASEWDKLVAAGTAERTVTVATYPGTGLRKAMDLFQAAYPGITVEHSSFQSASRDFAPRVVQELKAGLHTFDVAIMPPSEMFRQIRPIGGIDPIRPLIVQPDALDDKSWQDSFEGGFYDLDKKWCYTLAMLKSEEFWINTDEIKDGEITSFKDALNPKWKGKILGGDPRTKGSGYNSATVMRLKSGDDGIIKRLYVDQEVTLGTDARQLTELMIRGRYAIGIGAVDDNIVKDFRSQGLGQNIKSIPVVDLDYVYPNASVAWYMSSAPHPNAARVFINWLLSKDGGFAMSSNTGDNSRRSDVPPADPTRVPVKGVEYLRLQREEMLDEVQKTQDIAKSVLN